jgi:hypothetical protein
MLLFQHVQLTSLFLPPPPSSVYNELSLKSTAVSTRARHSIAPAQKERAIRPRSEQISPLANTNHVLIQQVQPKPLAGQPVRYYLYILMH